MSEEKPKEGVKTENDHINLKVAGQDGSVVQFKIKRHTPLSKLMKAYCERQVRAALPRARPCMCVQCVCPVCARGCVQRVCVACACPACVRARGLARRQLSGAPVGHRHQLFLVRTCHTACPSSGVWRVLLMQLGSRSAAEQ
uniref:Rad60/SUMO-like domain-containing protein n=1 Tax=Lynx canadensis TaxID=61383 RepID=A0A667GIK9_LYNCA